MLHRGMRLFSILAILACAAPVTAWAQTSYRFVITDPLRDAGGDLAAINTYFWKIWDAPGGIGPAGSAVISAEGLELSGFNIYLGIYGSAPIAEWALRGDFRISFYLNNEIADRTHFGIIEVKPSGTQQCAIAGTFYGLWGGGSFANPNSYWLTAGESGYFMIRREGSTISLFKGDEEGVSEESALLMQFPVSDLQADFIVYAGTGNPNYSGKLLIRDVVIETTDLVDCRGGTPIPDSWIPTADEDGDGVEDSLDLCPGTASGAVVDLDGCSIDQLASCGGAWKNHGEYVSTITHIAQEFLAAGLITEQQRNQIVTDAAHSSCGKKAKKDK